MRPRIGITSNFRMDPQPPRRNQLYLDAVYQDAVLAAGGLAQPIPVPPMADHGLLDALIAAYDGLVFTGGYDLHPRHYGTEPVHARSTVLHARRDAFEVALFRQADAARVPILALCLGFQVAAVARGGRLVQHVDDLELTPAVTHHLPGDVNAFHEVSIEPGSRLADVVGTTQLEVNSRHHQVVATEPTLRGLRPVAWAPDGVLEGAEDCDERFLTCVQWHPEDLIDRPEHLRLFAALVEEARRHAHARA